MSKVLHFTTLHRAFRVWCDLRLFSKKSSVRKCSALAQLVQAQSVWRSSSWAQSLTQFSFLYFVIFTIFFRQKAILYESEKIWTQFSFLYSPFFIILFRQNSSNQISKFDSSFIFSAFLLNTHIRFMQKSRKLFIFCNT